MNISRRLIVALALFLTAFIAFGVVLLLNSNISSNEKELIAQLSAAAAAAISILWLIVGLFIQSRELSLQRALHTEQVELTSDQIKVMEGTLSILTSQNAYILIPHAVMSLGFYARTIASDILPKDVVSELDQTYIASGNIDVYAMSLSDRANVPEVIKERLENPVIQNLVTGYINLYAKIKNESRFATVDGVLFTASPYSQLYDMLSEIK